MFGWRRNKQRGSAPRASTRRNQAAARRFRRLFGERLEPRALLAALGADDSFDLRFGGALTIASPGVLANDSGGSLLAVQPTQPLHGTLSFDAGGGFLYRPAAGYQGLDSFSYRVYDGAALSGPVTVSVRVLPNAAPEATTDVYSTQEDQPLTIGLPQSVLLNDTDADGDALSASVVNQPRYGILAFSPSGRFTYTPPINFTGVDSFTYRASDGAALSNLAMVTVYTVGCDHCGGGPQDDLYQIDEDLQLTVHAPGVLGNDVDTDTELPLPAVVSFPQPRNGVAEVQPSGSFRYTPQANFNGQDSFTYRLRDQMGLLSNEATVHVVVRPVNDWPVAVNDSYPAAEDTAMTVGAFGLLLNDYDVDGFLNLLSTQRVDGPSSGELILNANGGFTYSPHLNFHGVDSFTYRVSDGEATSENKGTVTISVAPACDPPIAIGDRYSVPEDTARTIPAPGVLSNDFSCEPGRPLSAAVETGPLFGVLSLAHGGGFTYTPPVHFFGDVSFTYHVADGTLSSNLATVTLTITPVNDAPLANHDSYDTPTDTPLSAAAPFGVLRNDADVDTPSATLLAIVASQPAHGRLAFDGSGGFMYWPDSGFTGADSFTYRASDGIRTSDLATVTITVVPLDLPSGEGGAASIAEDVNGDSFVSPLDALLIINALNAAQPAAADAAVSPYDVNGDDAITPLDALLIFNYLSAQIQNLKSKI